MNSHKLLSIYSTRVNILLFLINFTQERNNFQSFPSYFLEILLLILRLSFTPICRCFSCHKSWSQASPSECSATLPALGGINNPKVKILNSPPWKYLYLHSERETVATSSQKSARMRASIVSQSSDPWPECKTKKFPGPPPVRNSCGRAVKTIK